MDDKPCDRLRAARERAGFESAAAFAEYHDLAESTYRSHENGNRPLTVAAARRYAPLFGKSVAWQWLLFGETPEEVLKPPVIEKIKGRSIAGDKSDRSGNNIDIHERSMRPSMGGGAADMSDMPIKTTWSVPRDLLHFIGNAGLGGISILTVIGDSMEPTFRSRDKVMVDVADTFPSPPGVFVVWDGLGLVVKRVEFIPHSDPQAVRIYSDNKAGEYKPYERVLGEAYIQGRVIGKWVWT